MKGNKNFKIWNLQLRAFSLVEVLAAVAIIGIITFLAMPNIVAVKQDSETNLAISRAEALNIALVTLLQSNGRENVAEYWEKSTTSQDRYALLASYLAFAPANLDQYMPLGYRIDIPNKIEPLGKVSLSGPRGEIIY